MHFRFSTNLYLETAGRRAKEGWVGEIWASGVSIQCTQGILDS